MLILSGKYHLEKSFKKKDLENDVCFAVSNSGYSNDEIGVQWLEHSDECARKKRKGALRMLIMDGASCHTNEEFVRICYSKNLLPFRLPSHTTHLLQPLNIVYFQPLTHYHGLRNVIFILSKFGKVCAAKILRPVNASKMASWFRDRTLGYRTGP